MTQVLSIGDARVTVSGAGPALVFCHGFTTTGAFWREQIEPFSQTHRVVVLDLPGHGGAERPRSRRYTIDAFASDLTLIFDTLELQDAALVGLSMGGTIAQRFALLNAQRLKHLCLVGATPHGLGPDVHAVNVIEAIDRMGVQAASQAVIDRSFAPDAAPALVEFARQEVTQTPDFVAREAIESLNLADSRNDLGKLLLPTLVVCGTEDRITPPSESQALAVGIPHARLALIEKAAHFPMLEQPAAFNAVLREFLAASAM